MGTTGTGPVRPFPEKMDYKPDIRITYVDERGKEMESKDAFRVLSWKLVDSFVGNAYILIKFQEHGHDILLANFQVPWKRTRKEAN